MDKINADYAVRINMFTACAFIKVPDPNGAAVQDNLNR